MNMSLLRQFRSLTLLLQGTHNKAPGLLEPMKLSQINCAAGPTALSACQPVFKRWKVDDRRALIQSMPLKDMGTQGEKQLDVDLVRISNEEVYPDASTPDLLFEGIRFAELPIVHIKTSKNNTIIHITDALGSNLFYRSCGMDGFKNTRKGTNIAAQTTAINVAGMAFKKGMVNVRVMVRGLGPGRMSAVKGIQMAGLNIVSVTDYTPISWKPPRPRKARRL